MFAIALTAGLAVFFFAIALFSGSGSTAENVNSRLKHIGAIDAAASAEAAKKNGIDVKKLTKVLLGVNTKKKKPSNNAKTAKPATKLDKMLMLAEMNMTGSQWTLIKYFITIIVTLAVFFICTKLNLEMKFILLGTVGAMVICIFLLGKVVTSKVKKKKEAIRRDLPDIIDLLVVSVEAGLGFDAALTRLYEKNKCIVMHELMRTQQDQRRGLSKKDAYTALMERCDCREITSFANAVLQAEQMGISMKTILTAQSETLREERSDRAHEKAEKAPVKMMLPMVIFVFPCIFVILLAPAAVNILEMMS